MVLVNGVHCADSVGKFVFTMRALAHGSVVSYFIMQNPIITALDACCTGQMAIGTMNGRIFTLDESIYL